MEMVRIMCICDVCVYVYVICIVGDVLLLVSEYIFIHIRVSVRCNYLCLSVGIDGMNCLTTLDDTHTTNTNIKTKPVIFSSCVVKGNSDSKVSRLKFGPYDVPNPDHPAQLKQYNTDVMNILSQQYLIKI